MIVGLPVGSNGAVCTLQVEDEIRLLAQRAYRGEAQGREGMDRSQQEIDGAKRINLA